MCVDSDRAEKDSPEMEKWKDKAERQNCKPGENVAGGKNSILSGGRWQQINKVFLLNLLLYIPSILKHSILKWHQKDKKTS